MRGQIFTTIKAGTPPATRTRPIDPQGEAFWDLLDRCWMPGPSDRPKAQQLLTELRLPPFATTSKGKEISVTDYTVGEGPSGLIPEPFPPSYRESAEPAQNQSLYQSPEPSEITTSSSAFRGTQRGEPSQRLPKDEPHTRSKQISPNRVAEPSSVIVAITNNAKPIGRTSSGNSAPTSTFASTPCAAVVTSRNQAVSTNLRTTEEPHLSPPAIAKINPVIGLVPKPQETARVGGTTRLDQTPWVLLALLM
jgi:hypothetical protein